MPYKENCKAEGEILTKFKIARLFFAQGEKQNKIAQAISCHKNTVYDVVRACRMHTRDNPLIMDYLQGKAKIEIEVLNELFDFLKYGSRRPKSNKNCLGEVEEIIVLEKFKDLNYGPKRMFKHLKRGGYDLAIYTPAKIKGVYKRNQLKLEKVKTKNGNRRALYAYDRIEAFEYLQYDTKEILDLKALPEEIYDKFKNNSQLPKYQWTIVDAKTKVRFLAWSYSLCSYFGFKFLEYVLNWLRGHGVKTKINVQMDGGAEFCSASLRKLQDWNNKLAGYNVNIYDTRGAKWKQNLVERTHRIDDEEFYCPRGEMINTKPDFLAEGQKWIIDYNNRSSDSIGLNGISPKEKLSRLGYFNAQQICNFPILILEDWFEELKTFFIIKIPKYSVCQNFQKSQNVLTHYQKLTKKQIITRFIEDIKIPILNSLEKENQKIQAKQVIKQNIEKGYCPNCKKWHSVIPITNQRTRIGPAARQFAAYATNVLRLSYEQTKSILLDLYNNKAERKLRPLVIKRKNCFGTKTEKGNKMLEINYSVLMSLWWNDRNNFFVKFNQLMIGR